MERKHYCNKKKNKKKGSVKIFGLGALLGIIIGAIIGIFNAPKKGEDLLEEVLEKKDDILVKLTETKKQVQKKVDVIFGKITKESVGIYADTRREILNKVANGKKKIKKADFEKIVDDVINKYKKNKKHYSPKLDALSKEFKKDWGIIKKNLQK